MKILALIFTLCISSEFVYSQNDDGAEIKELYPAEYTFEKANEFKEKGELEKAVWFYINLYPENKEQVVKEVKGLKEDSGELPLLIKTSFTMYGPFALNEQGEVSMNLEEMMRKGKWGDQLIAAVTEKPLQTCTDKDCRRFKTGKFKYIGKNEGVTIIRDESYHIETDGIRSLKLKIDWVNDCEFKLTYVDVNEAGDEYLLDKSIYVTIYEVSGDSYKYISENEGQFSYGEIEKTE